MNANLDDDDDDDDDMAQQIPLPLTVSCFRNTDDVTKVANDGDEQGSCRAA